MNPALIKSRKVCRRDGTFWQGPKYHSFFGIFQVLRPEELFERLLFAEYSVFCRLSHQNLFFNLPSEFLSPCQTEITCVKPWNGSLGCAWEAFWEKFVSLFLAIFQFSRFFRFELAHAIWFGQNASQAHPRLLIHTFSLFYLDCFSDENSEGKSKNRF